MKKQTYTVKRHESCMNFTAGAVDSLRIKNGVATTVRVYDQGYIGVSGASGDCDVAELENKAVGALSNKVPYPCEKSAPAKMCIDKRKEIIKKSELVGKCRALVAELVAQNPDFILSGKLDVTDKVTKFEDSDGVEYESCSSFFSAYCVAKHKDSSNIMDEVYGVTDDRFEPEKIAHDLKKLLDAFLAKADLPDEEKPVFITDESVVEYLVGAFVAERYCSGTSILKDKLGKKAFSEKFTLVCDRDPDDNPGVTFFDGEGVVNDGFKAYLVKKGVIENLLTTKKSAATLKVKNSGTAASPYAGVPSLGAEGLKVEKTAEDVLALIGNKKAVYVTTASGGDMTPTGEIGLPVQCAYLFENGKLVGKLPEFSISCNVFDMLGDDYIGACDKCVNEAGRNRYLVFRAKAVNKQ